MLLVPPANPPFPSRWVLPSSPHCGSGDCKCSAPPLWQIAPSRGQPSPQEVYTPPLCIANDRLLQGTEGWSPGLQGQLSNADRL